MTDEKTAKLVRGLQREVHNYKNARYDSVADYVRLQTYRLKRIKRLCERLSIPMVELR